MRLTVLLLLLLLTIGTVVRNAQAAIGVNWGTLSHHRLTAKTVVDLLKQNNISKVKLFDADHDVVGALRGTDIQVIVGIPNDFLPLISSSPSAADTWKNWNLLSVNVAMTGTGLYQLGRKIQHDFFQEAEPVPAKE